MRNFLTALSVFLTWSIFAFWYFSTYTSLYIGNIFSNEIVTSKVVEEEEALFKDNGFLDASLYHGIESDIAVLKAYDPNSEIIFSLDTVYFKKNQQAVQFKNGQENPLLKVHEYLEQNPDQELIIHSDYCAFENFSTPNYGVKRGQYLAGQLEKLGTDKELIKIRSSIKELFFDENSTHYGGISFYFKTMSEERKKDVEENKKQNEIPTDNVPIRKNIYPIFTYTNIVVNEEMEKFANELHTTLKNNPHKKATIIGHTDNVGDQKDNYELGLMYANQVRAYLIYDTGIDPEKLTATSKGKLAPIATNSTPAGREKNQRIEIIID